MNGQLQYEGNVANGRPDGYGKLYYENVNIKYEGMFAKGKKHGIGKSFYENKEIEFHGTFENGLPKEGIKYDREGRIEFIGTLCIDFF